MLIFRDDLPAPDLTMCEVSVWKNKWLDVPADERPTTLAGALFVIDEDSFPNLFILLKIAVTLPVTSCECERSFSTLRRLRGWLRTSMKEDRLSGLGILAIHREHPVDYKEAVNIFVSLHPRKLDSANLLYNV